MPLLRVLHKTHDAKMWATPKTSSPSLTWGPREVVWKRRDASQRKIQLERACSTTTGTYSSGLSSDDLSFLGSCGNELETGQRSAVRVQSTRLPSPPPHRDLPPITAPPSPRPFASPSFRRRRSRCRQQEPSWSAAGGRAWSSELDEQNVGSPTPASFPPAFALPPPRCRPSPRFHPCPALLPVAPRSLHLASRLSSRWKSLQPGWHRPLRCGVGRQWSCRLVRKTNPLLMLRGRDGTRRRRAREVKNRGADARQSFLGGNAPAAQA